MRLLLLLSALFTALAGVTGTRAQAQPVQASTAALAPATAVAVPARSVARFAVAAYAALPPLQPPLPRILGAASRRLLYAERRRE